MESSIFTALISKSCSMRLDRHFVVDRPFYYTILDKHIGTILFEGRLANRAL